MKLTVIEISPFTAHVHVMLKGSSERFYFKPENLTNYYIGQTITIKKRGN